jgi:CYTH domain-containing protein
MTPTSWQLKRIGTGRVTTEHARKYERVERERRYLLRELPPGLKSGDPHAQITDNYITNTRLRLRKSRWPTTNEWTLKLTQKYTPDPPDFSRTLITSIYLSEEEYEVLSIFEGNELRKNRYPYEHEGRKYAVDLFLGSLHGLILAETDFETDEEMDAFPTPPFAVMDVTRDEMFTGAKLVELSADDIREELSRRAAAQSIELNDKFKHAPET